MAIKTIDQAVAGTIDAIVNDINLTTKATSWSATAVYIKLGVGLLNMIGYTATAIDHVAQAIVLHAETIRGK